MKLEVNNLKKSYGEKLVLDDIDFSFESGKIYGLIGRNGAGKTTFFNSLNSDIDIDSGSFYLEDEYGKNSLSTNDIGYVVSTPIVPEFLTAREFLEFFMEINKDKTFKNIEKKLVNTYEKAAYDFVRLSEIDFNEDENIVRDVLNVLVDEEKIVKINDEMFTLKSLMDKVEILVKEKLAQDNLITISQLRDALNTSRKSAKPMLEYLDNMKITRKNGTESERVGY